MGCNKGRTRCSIREVVSCIRESGLKLNKEKCILGARSLTFLGHILSSEGVRPDLAKIDAIVNMPLPKSVTELQSFLGMMNYLIKFVPNLAQITAPLRDLLKKNVEFILEKPQLDAIQELKSSVTSSPCLKYFNANLPT